MRWPPRASIDAEDAAALGDAYDRLRTLEHRLQMVDDQQTHVLPAGGASSIMSRGSMGCRTARHWSPNWRDVTDTVARRYDRLIEADETEPAYPGTR